MPTSRYIKPAMETLRLLGLREFTPRRRHSRRRGSGFGHHQLFEMMKSDDTPWQAAEKIPLMRIRNSGNQ
jgi:hypothetical protein